MITGGGGGRGKTRGGGEGYQKLTLLAQNKIAAGIGQAQLGHQC